MRKLKNKFCLIYRSIINFFICLRYPFLKIDTPVYPWLHGYESIWIDELEQGWKKRFGWKLCKELRAYLKDNNVKDYHILQVKEKFGTLCWYDNWFETHGNYDLHNKVIQKYIDMASNTCVICGKPSDHKSIGYILPYCNKCHKEGDVCHHDIRYNKSN